MKPKNKAAEKEVVRLLLKYDMTEARAINWRRKNNFKLKTDDGSTRYKKFFFVANDAPGDIMDSIFCHPAYESKVRSKVRVLLKKYPNLRCYSDYSICCGDRIQCIELSGDYMTSTCNSCGHIYYFTDKERKYIGKSSNRAMARILLFKKYRKPAVLIWESK